MLATFIAHTAVRSFCCCWLTASVFATSSAHFLCFFVGSGWRHVHSVQCEHFQIRAGIGCLHGLVCACRTNLVCSDASLFFRSPANSQSASGAAICTCNLGYTVHLQSGPQRRDCSQLVACRRDRMADPALPAWLELSRPLRATRRARPARPTATPLRPARLPLLARSPPIFVFALSLPAN